jgi:hypothetical protein
MTLEVEETEDGFIFTWDPFDPVESVFNNWTEHDFEQMLINAAEKVIAKHEIVQKSSNENIFEQEFMAK